MTQPQGAHLVGSVNYDDAETTMRTAAIEMRGLLRRIPDGEPGSRFHWIMFQPDVLGETDGLERVGAERIPLRGLDARPLRIADGVDASSLRLPPLGYAAAARASYRIFTRLREEGIIAAGVRFQVALPTPVAVVGSFFSGDDRAAFEPVYRDAMAREVDEILAAIPHEDLAVQWDCAVEFALIETHIYSGGVQPWWDSDLWEGVVARAADVIDLIPAGVEAGVHLCYGDVAEKHFVEPADTGNLVRFANSLIEEIKRPLTWLHLPVPIERDDDAYFAALEGLALPAGTELYLGLVHREDGAEGAHRRIQTALRHAPAFGVATECGIGRAPAGTTEGILRTHAEVAAPW
ncbi:MAG: hypothetical protein QM677_05520 [Microbacterium sp.]